MQRELEIFRTMSLSSELKSVQICIMGCGRVGLVTGACLAAIGHRVVCVDRDAERIHSLEQGALPVYETHLPDVIRRGRDAAALSFTSDATEPLRTADAIFLCIGVPQLDSGEPDFFALDAAARKIARSVDSSKLIVERSTVPVKTGTELKHLFRASTPNSSVHFRIAASPQFSRAGTAVEDFFHPVRLLLGVDDPESEAALGQIYAPILRQAFPCPLHPDGCPSRQPPELVLTSVQSAELIKLVSNSYLAIKISYANVLADLCERLGANVQEVTHAMGLDARINSAFLQAGIGFGGERLPTDLRAFCRLLAMEGVDAGIAQAAEQVNRQRVDAFFRKTERLLWVLKGKKIGVLGVAHKADTDDIRASPAIELCTRLSTAGARISAFDPRALSNARAVHADFEYCNSPYETAERADALLVLTDWEEFRNLDWRSIRDRMARPCVLDGRNFLSPDYMKSLGFEYVSVGRPA